MSGVCRSLLVVTVALLFLSHTARSRLDCTKFVFAPRCRGVAAKRGHQQLAEHKKSPLPEQTHTLDRLTNPARLKTWAESLMKEKRPQRFPSRADLAAAVRDWREHGAPSVARDSRSARWRQPERRAADWEDEKWRHFVQSSQKDDMLLSLLDELSRMDDGAPNAMVNDAVDGREGRREERRDVDEAPPGGHLVI